MSKIGLFLRCWCCLRTRLIEAELFDMEGLCRECKDKCGWDSEDDT